MKNCLGIGVIMLLITFLSNPLRGDAEGVTTSTTYTFVNPNTRESEWSIRMTTLSKGVCSVRLSISEQAYEDEFYNSKQQEINIGSPSNDANLRQQITALKEDFTHCHSVIIPNASSSYFKDYGRDVLLTHRKGALDLAEGEDLIPDRAPPHCFDTEQNSTATHSFDSLSTIPKNKISGICLNSVSATKHILRVYTADKRFQSFRVRNGFSALLHVLFITSHLSEELTEATIKKAQELSSAISQHVYASAEIGGLLLYVYQTFDYATGLWDNVNDMRTPFDDSWGLFMKILSFVDFTTDTSNACNSIVGVQYQYYSPRLKLNFVAAPLLAFATYLVAKKYLPLEKIN